MKDGISQTRGSLWSSIATLFASSSTLVCCAFPAMMVALGAGATLSSWVLMFPQLIWLSEHKAAVFGFAGAALAISGWIQWRTRSAPCPMDPGLRDACWRTRKASVRIYFVSLIFYLTGGWFAFVRPHLLMFGFP
jgi:hypothetical protein